MTGMGRWTKPLRGTVNGSGESAAYVCPDCGAPMLVIDIFLGGQLPRAPPVKVGES